MQQQTPPMQGQGVQQAGERQSQGQPQQEPVGQQGQMGQPGQVGQPSELGQTSQMGQQAQQMGQQAQQMGLALQDVETPEQRAAVDYISRAIQVCGWCADQCIEQADPSMIECIRLCHDVTEFGETALALVPRNSQFTQPILQAFEQAAHACAQECGQHRHAHCQECAQVLPQAAQSVQQYTATTGGQRGGPQTGLQ